MQQEEIVEFFNKRFGHLSESERVQAIGNFMGTNLMDLHDLCDVANKRALRPDELQEGDELIAFELWANNTAAVDSWRDAKRKHREHSAGMVKQVPKKPKTIRAFEDFLRDAGYSRAEAKSICSLGFKPDRWDADRD